MIYLNQYCTEFMFLVVLVCVTLSSKLSSHIIVKFSLVFDYFCWNLCRHVLIMKFRKKNRQTTVILWKRKEISNFERQYYCRKQSNAETITGRIMNSVQLFFTNNHFNYFHMSSHHFDTSQYTDTGPTCRCAIHWRGTSHWNTQLPILMTWVRPDHEILPDLPQTLNFMILVYGGSRSEAR